MNNNHRHHRTFLTKTARSLKQDLLRSPLHDVKEFTDCHGKLFATDRGILGAEVARPVPAFPARSLLNQRVDVQAWFGQHQASLLVLSMSSAGAQHVGPFRDAVDGVVPVYDVHVTVGSLRGLLLGWLVRRQLRQSVAADKWPTVLTATCRPGHFDSLGAYNRYGGYVYLVDALGRARWRASGPPTDSDQRALRQAVDQLHSSYGVS